MLSVFHYNSYWGTWSRRWFKDGFFVELDLIDGVCRGPEYFRYHGTARGKDDIITHQLPKQAYQKMVSEYGQKMTDRMLTFEYFTLFTFDDVKKANTKSNGGGVPISHILSIKNGVDSFWKNK